MAELDTNTRILSSGKKLLFRQESVFWITAIILLFIFLWDSAFRETETLLAEQAREMLQTGNWLYPTFNWSPLPWQFPAGTWSIVPFTALLGNTEFAARIPAALGALGTFWGVRVLGRQFFNPGIACMSCWLLLGCGGFLLWSRSADTDMLYTAVVTAAAAWFFHRKENFSFLYWLTFFLLCFAGALLEGPAAALIPLALILPTVWNAETRRTYLNGKSVLAFLISLFFYFLLLYLPFLLKNPSETEFSLAQLGKALTALRDETLQPSFQGFLIPQRWYSPLLHLPRELLPWTPLLLIGWIGFVKNWQDLRKNVRDAALGTTAALVILLLSGVCYRSHMLVMFPLLILFGAAGLNFHREKKWNSKAFAVGYYVSLCAASFALCSIIAYPLWNKIADCTPPAALVAAPVIAGAVSWLALFMDHGSRSSLARFLGLPPRSGAVIFSGTVLTGCIMSVLFPVIQEEFRTEKKFFLDFHQAARKALPDLKSSQIVVFKNKIPGEYLFYNALTSPVSHTDDLKKMIMKHPGEKVIVLFRNRPKVRRLFFRQCRQYGIQAKDPFAVQEISRWNSPEARHNYYVSYLITLPAERNKK